MPRRATASRAWIGTVAAARIVRVIARHRGLRRTIVRRQNESAYGVWRLEREGEPHAVKVHGMLSSNDGDIVPSWALDGHGILLRSEWDIAKFRESGRLRVALPEYVQPSADLFVY